MQRLHFVEHPRHGSVYPIVTMNDKESWQVWCKTTAVGLSFFNASVLYSTFVLPIYTAQFASIVANPIFILPSLTLNYLLYQRYYVYFYGNRCQVINMYLKPNGKELLIETRDKECKTVNISDIYDAKVIQTSYEQRIDFGHGANNYLFLRGNSIVYDSWVLSAVLEGNFINARNSDYDFDVTKEFTWEFRDLVEIKKRKRVVERVYKPTMDRLAKLVSAKAWIQGKRNGTLASKVKPHPDYFMYEMMPDKYEEDKAKVAQTVQQHEWNVSNGGKPFSAKKVEKQGRRVKSY